MGMDSCTGILLGGREERQRAFCRVPRQGLREDNEHNYAGIGLDDYDADLECAVQVASQRRGRLCILPFAV